MSAKEDLMNLIISNTTNNNIDDIDKFRAVLSKSLENFNVEQAEKSLTVVDNSDYEIFKKFIVSKKIEGRSDRTLEYYTNTFNTFYKWLNGRCSIFDCSVDTFRAYFADGMLNMNWSGCNINNQKRNLSSFWTWLRDEEYVKRNPLMKIQKIKNATHIREPFTKTEIELLRNSTKNKRDRAILEFLLSTGCRVGEAEFVKIKDIDFSRQELVVCGKGNKTRTVFLNESAIYHIQEYLKSRDDDNEYLFVSLEKPHKRLKASGFEIRIRDLGREVNVKAFPHKFRHTAATWALNNGMPIEQVKEILGHESVETTLIYAKINQSELKYSHQKYMS